VIFLSHSWQNKPAARKIVEALATEGIPCWLDEQQLDDGAELRASLRSAISQSDVYLYLVSNAANESRWAQDELQYALGMEHEQRLRIIPVRLVGNEDALPPLLIGRIYTSLDPSTGGVAGLTNKISQIKGHDRIPEHCRLSATVRLEEHRLAHTLKEIRALPNINEIHVLLLDNQYEALDVTYWNLSEIRFPEVQNSHRDIAYAVEFMADIHKKSRAIIKEARAICHRFLSTNTSHKNHYYFDAGNERALRVLLNRLQWNSNYLRKLRDREDIDQEFESRKYLPEPFDGHRCDFVSNGEKLSSIAVPKHGHPFSPGMKEILPWGSTSPFLDILGDDVGIAIGEIVALRFMAGTRFSTELPLPDTLTYGLS
jgi:hypothetical protein